MRNKVRIILRTIAIILFLMELIFVISAFFSMDSTITLPVKSETVHLILRVCLAAAMCLFALSFAIAKDNQSRQDVMTGGGMLVILAALFLLLAFIIHVACEWLYIEIAMFVAGGLFPSGCRYCIFAFNKAEIVWHKGQTG